MDSEGLEGRGEEEGPSEARRDEGIVDGNGLCSAQALQERRQDQQ